jgi:H+/Cl- antiporter ClcA
MALVKLALLAVAFKSGFLGGPTFPAIFASICVALAVGQLAPGLPVDVLVGGIMGGFLLVLFKAPLMVILLVATMLQANLQLIALVLLAVAVVMVVLPYVVASLERLQRPSPDGAGPPPATGPAAT